MGVEGVQYYVLSCMWGGPKGEYFRNPPVAHRGLKKYTKNIFMKTKQFFWEGWIKIEGEKLRPQECIRMKDFCLFPYGNLTKFFEFRPPDFTRIKNFC